VRLTSMEVTFPRFILAEFNTHRVFSRNSASSRAIPFEKCVEQVRSRPFIPIYWGKKQRGMQADTQLKWLEAQAACRDWLKIRDAVVKQAEQLYTKYDLHKQIVNRLLEPFMWHTVLVTATEWKNFFNLRDNRMAQPEMRHIARMMQNVYQSSVPRQLQHGEWHLPLIRDDDRAEANLDVLLKVSTGRCARLSYMTHHGFRDLSADVQLHDDLLRDGHMSPFEHAARPMTQDDVIALTNIPALRPNEVFSANFRGWFQYRKSIPGEAIFVPKEETC
jgi:hypothetical protein